MIIFFMVGEYCKNNRNKKTVIKIQYAKQKWILYYQEKNKREIVEPIQLIAFPLTIIFLRFKRKNQKKIKTLLLWEDSMTPESFHQMLLMARLQ